MRRARSLHAPPEATSGTAANLPTTIQTQAKIFGQILTKSRFFVVSQAGLTPMRGVAKGLRRGHTSRGVNQRRKRLAQGGEPEQCAPSSAVVRNVISHEAFAAARAEFARSRVLDRYRLGEDAELGTLAELICKDERGLYVLPFPGRRSHLGWINPRSHHLIRSPVIGWRELPEDLESPA
jgi:hypothetical protein